MKFCEEKRKKNVFAVRYGVQPPAAGHSQSAITSPRRPSFLCCAQLRTDPKGNGRPESLAAVKDPSNGRPRITASPLVCPWRPPQDCTPV